MPQTIPAIEAALEAKSERLFVLHALYKETMELLMHHQIEATAALNAEVDCWASDKPEDARAQQALANEHLEEVKKIRADYGGVIADYQELIKEVETLQQRLAALLDLENL